MPFIARVFPIASSVLSACALAGAGLAETGSVLGFGYCPPPIVPSCIDRAAHMRSRKELDACSRDVLRFTQTLGAYRTCLNRESQRAIGSGNNAIARFRCITQHDRPCSASPGETER